MTEAIALDWARVTGPEGLDLLRRFLGGDQSAAPGLAAIIDAAETGCDDTNYAGNPGPEKIHVTTSCHRMVMALLSATGPVQIYRWVGFLRLNADYSFRVEDS